MRGARESMSVSNIRQLYMAVYSRCIYSLPFYCPHTIARDKHNADVYSLLSHSRGHLSGLALVVKVFGRVRGNEGGASPGRRQGGARATRAADEEDRWPSRLTGACLIFSQSNTSVAAQWSRVSRNIDQFIHMDTGAAERAYFLISFTEGYICVGTNFIYTVHNVLSWVNLGAGMEIWGRAMEIYA
ncbi:hypothetical protein BDZ91DRAFT_716358 [Kalaharituber pfeilii]|nr:hypothetical protein BDZ91DRAFT_716358 [Kalaharituber pfeilii]